MNLLEAIQGAGENWFRPIGLIGIGYGIDAEGFLTKYTKIRDPYNLVCLPIIYLLGEWEIVTPEQVLSERKL